MGRDEGSLTIVCYQTRKEGEGDLRQAEEMKRPPGKECVWHGVQEMVTSAEALGGGCDQRVLGWG